MIHPGDEQFIGVLSFTGTRHRLQEGGVIHPVSEIYILPRKLNNSQTFNHVGADIIRPLFIVTRYRAGKGDIPHPVSEQYD